MLNKKILIISVALIVLASGFYFYNYLVVSNVKVETKLEETTNTGTVNLKEEGLFKTPEQVKKEVKETPKDNSGGFLSVCVDKCGDGVCQKVDTVCESGGLNCVCEENLQECPQDCR